MQPFSLSEFLAQLGLAPRLGPPPAAAPPQPAPYDTSVVPGTAFGAPTAFPPPVPAPTDTGPMHIPRDTAAAPAAVDPRYGAAPQPRAALPSQLSDTGINPDLFDTYRKLYGPAAQDADPLAHLMNSGTPDLPGFRGAPPPSRALVPPGYAHQAAPSGGAQGPLTPAEHRLASRGPQFARVVDRVRQLQMMRDRKGF